MSEDAVHVLGPGDCPLCGEPELGHDVAACEQKMAMWRPTGLAALPGFAQVSAAEASDDLLTWLRPQLDADERVASAAAARRGGAWSVSYYDYEQPDGYADGVDAEDGPVISSGDIMVPEAEHIACHDPARVLRQVEAHRKILDLAESAAQREVQNASGPVARLEKALAKVTAPELERVVRLLASIYSDRPGYRDEWRPS